MLHQHPGVVDPRNPRVVEMAERQDFAAETTLGGGSSDVGTQDLQRHVARRIVLNRLVYRSHSAPADRATDREAADAMASRQRRFLIPMAVRDRARRENRSDALAGVAIDVQAAIRMAPVVIPLALLRMGALVVGVRAGARGLDLEPAQREALWQGLVAQAGVAIGLAALLAEAYPSAGGQMQTLLLAFIAVNGTVGPILFRRALGRAGEVGT